MCLKKLVKIITFLALSAPGLEAFASRKNREFMVFYLLSRSLCVSTFFPCIRESVGILSHAVIRVFFFLFSNSIENRRLHHKCINFPGTCIIYLYVFFFIHLFIFYYYLLEPLITRPFLSFSLRIEYTRMGTID